MPSAPIRMSASAVSTAVPSRSTKRAVTWSRCLREARDAAAELDPVRAQHLPRGVEQDHLQLAAMDRELRPRQAGMAAARIGPDRLAVAVGIAQLARLDGGRGQRRLEAEAAEDAHGAGLDVDADAQRLQLAHRLEHLDIEAGAMEAHRGDESADAGAGNDDLHRGAQASRLRPRYSRAAW